MFQQKFSPHSTFSVKLFLFSSILTCLCTFRANGQSSPQDTCVVMVADSTEMMQIEEAITFPQPKNIDGCATFRVVVHVVYDGSTTDPAQSGYISEAQVLSQIRATNQFFRNDSTLAHPDNTPFGFTYELATTDPDGNPTSGIIYHDGYDLFGEVWSTLGLRSSNAEAVSPSVLASEIAWGEDMEGKKYLNCYVVPRIDGSNGSGIQAFAYFPTNGIVYGNYNLANAFGAVQFEDDYNENFELKSYTNLGFTWTHELLHNVGIWHTFQGNSCGAESNCQMMSDRVCDTPPQTQGMGCSGSCGFVSNNVMDYLSQSCKHKITPGQIERANLVINNSLSEYLLCEDCPGNNGDFNGDGIVNIIDISSMSPSFGCSEGSACYNPIFDLNCDGAINILDVSMMVMNQSPVNISDIQGSNLIVYDMMGRLVESGNLSTGLYIIGIGGDTFQKVFLVD